jgi:hypothetical protein
VNTELVVHFVLGISVAAVGGRTDNQCLGSESCFRQSCTNSNKSRCERKSLLVTLPAGVDGNGSKDKKTLGPTASSYLKREMKDRNEIHRSQ